MDTRGAPERPAVFFMNDTYIIELNDMAVGIVIGEATGYRFFASSQAFHPIEGRLFASPRAAEKAARALAGQLRKLTPPRVGQASPTLAL